MLTHVKRVAIAATALTLPAGMALARGGPPWGWDSGYWFFPGFRFLFVLACIALFIYVIVQITRRPAPTRGGFGLDILGERLARGEIDKAEYEEKRRILTGG